MSTLSRLDLPAPLGPMIACVEPGLTVIEKADADEALGFLLEHATEVAAVFTDINMPEMDGFELIEAVRAVPEFRGLPILVLSTEFSDEKKARARGAGATGWITKPFDAAKLGTAIRRVCP